MRCGRCGRKISEGVAKCPHCGAQAGAGASGTFQTSTVLISAQGEDYVYRSVDEVPQALRTKLLKSTNGANSATILIADRGGRKEIARAMKNLPAHAQKRLMQSILAKANGELWLSTGRRRAILAAVGLLALAAVGLVFGRW